MNIDIDEMQERISYRLHEGRPYKPTPSIGPEIIHLTEKLGVFVTAYIDNRAQMPDAVADIIIVSLDILAMMNRKASQVLEQRVANYKPFGTRPLPTNKDGDPL